MAGSQQSLLPLPVPKGTAPFLHVGALVAITALSWIVAGQFARAERSCKYDWAGPVPHPCDLSTKASLPCPHLDCAWAAWGCGGALARSMASPGSEWPAGCTEVTASALPVSSSVSLHLCVS